MKIQLKYYEYTVLLKPQPEGGYSVEVPALPGCITEGETQKESLKNAKEAIELYLEDLTQSGEAIPKDIKTIDKVIRLNLPAHVPKNSCCKT